MRSKQHLLSSDGSIKHLVELSDGLFTETVWIPQEDGVNLCVSSQVGCPNKCRHCATANVDYERDLTTEEIVAEAQLLIDSHGDCGGQRHVLFMGMGEPLLNYSNVLSAVRTMLQDSLIASPAHAVLSTSGMIPGILQLIKEDIRPRLAITIATVDDGKRAKLIPTTKIFPVDDLLLACRRFQEATSDRIIFGIPLIASFNDTEEDAGAIACSLGSFDCELQIVPFNHFSGSKDSRPSAESISNYVAVLEKEGMTVSTKFSYGVDISAGCGQLASVEGWHNAMP